MTPKTRPQWIADLDMYDLDHSIFDWMCRADDHMDYLTAMITELREVLQLLYDTSDATPGTAQWEDYELAIRQAEAALKGVER